MSTQPPKPPRRAPAANALGGPLCLQDPRRRGGACLRWAGSAGPEAPGRSPRAAHPESERSTMNVVQIFFLKILGIQLWRPEQGGDGNPVQSRGTEAPPGAPPPTPEPGTPGRPPPDSQVCTHSPPARPRNPGPPALPQTQEPGLQRLSLGTRSPSPRSALPARPALYLLLLRAHHAAAATQRPSPSGSLQSLHALPGPPCTNRIRHFPAQPGAGVPETRQREAGKGRPRLRCRDKGGGTATQGCRGPR